VDQAFVKAELVRGRFASGILETLGLPDLVASDKSAYVQTAVRIAQDCSHRARLREQLPPRRATVFLDQSAIDGLSGFLTDS
jgi:predicted O-linked N-acetylglucosamine transferase (SPINDLY family)